MARAALDWNASRLASAAGIGVATVNRFEKGSVETAASTVAKLRTALESAGVIFIEQNGEGPGVRLRKGASD